MQVSKEAIVTLLFECLDELNQQMGAEQKIKKSVDSVLVGNGDKGLDSLGFVNLVALVEEKCQERFGKTLVLTEETAPGARDPFESVGTLAEYIELALAGGRSSWR